MRFHGTKTLAKIGRKTMIEGVINLIPRSRLHETIVVLGHDAELVAPSVRAKRGVKVAFNPDYRSGMASSLRTGLAAVSRTSPGVLIVLADQVFLTRRLVVRLLKAFEGSGREAIVASSTGSLTSPPVIFPRRYFDELGRLSGDQGARSVIARHKGALVLVSAGSQRELDDVDTLKDLQRARGLLER